MQIGYKKRLAKNLAGVDEGESAQIVNEQSEYFDRIFGLNTN
jgi:4-hydroxybutyryl-CoA dehydratase / vinylacetyl-CoA-Delta-isomerase